MKYLILFISLLANGIYACTAFQLRAQDGTQLYCRSMEFGIPMESDMLIIPVNYSFTATTPDGKEGLSWKTRYGACGMNQVFGPTVLTDGLNEKGLVVGSLYLAGYTQYPAYDPNQAQNSIAPWELPNLLLTTCANIDEVKATLSHIRVVEQNAPGFSVLPLHFFIADSNGKCIVVEYVNQKERIIDHSLGVLTNSPPLEWHILNMANYINLSTINVPHASWGEWKFDNFGNGSGLLGLPGDPTPPSRFIRAAFFSHFVTPPKNAIDGVCLGFHILNTFDIFDGLIQKKNEKTQVVTNTNTTQWITVYDQTNHKCFVRNYESLQINLVDFNQIDFHKKQIYVIPLSKNFSFIDITKQSRPSPQ